MSNELVFTILPYNPIISPIVKIQPPIDLDDFANQLRNNWPMGDVRVDKSETETNIYLFVKTKTEDVWDMAGFLESYNQFFVRGWPKHIAKDIIYWYRQYVPMDNRLFLIIPEKDFIAELTATTTLDDIEEMYPYPVSDE